MLYSIRNTRDGGFMQVDTKPDFDGTVLESYTANRRDLSSGTVAAFETFTYTTEDRLLKHTHRIGNSGTVQLLSMNSYDALGQLVSKKVGGTDVTATTALQKVDYSYNIRSWLKGINDINDLNADTGGDLFAFKINYNDAITEDVNDNVQQLYNGNIAETYWRSSSDNIKRRYGYKYDNLNRLLNAYYQKPDNVNPVTNSYNESLSYDKNGNITGLLRTGDYDDNVYRLEIDNLAYTYNTTQKNQLVKVMDSTNSPSGFTDGTNTDNDYEYDAYGNLKLDRNKGITSIRYNHLNLPVEIVFDANQDKKITYLYNAAGLKKMKKVVIPSLDPSQRSVTTQTDYLDGFQYNGSGLQYFPTAEGYVDHTKSASTGNSIYSYVYQYKDHLGNIRLNYAWDAVRNVLIIKDESHYYPFGLKHNNYNVEYLEFQEEWQNADMVTLDTPLVTPFRKAPYNYKYQGQERQDELGLNWDSFKWRNYDYAIGRFMSIDPLAEEYTYQTPYQFASNQPVHANEIEGLESRDDLNLRHTTTVENDAITRTNNRIIPAKATQSSNAKGLNNLNIKPSSELKIQYQGGYVGQSLIC